MQLVDGFTKIVQNASEPFIGHQQGQFVCGKKVFKRFFRVFITLQNYVNEEFDETETLMTSKELKKMNAIEGNRTLSRNMEYLKND